MFTTPTTYLDKFLPAKLWYTVWVNRIQDNTVLSVTEGRGVYYPNNLPWQVSSFQAVVHRLSQQDPG